MIRVESGLLEAYSTDQSYEVSCQDINFVPCPMRFSCLTQGCLLRADTEKISLFEKIGE